MRVRLTLDVGDYERFVVAKYFAPAGSATADRERTRATRKQVVRFAQAAFRRGIADQARDLPMRSFRAAERLKLPAAPREVLPPPREEQRSLRW